MPIDAETNTAMPPAFLMQQMEWREALDDARDAQDLALKRFADGLNEQLRQVALEWRDPATLQRTQKDANQNFDERLRKLLVDTDDPALNRSLSGYLRITTGYKDQVIYPVANPE